jgi:hypothetical protein
MTLEVEKAYVDTLTIALRRGYDILSRGGSSRNLTAELVRNDNRTGARGAQTNCKRTGARCEQDRYEMRVTTGQMGRRAVGNCLWHEGE